MSSSQYQHHQDQDHQSGKQKIKQRKKRKNKNKKKVKKVKDTFLLSTPSTSSTPSPTSSMSSSMSTSMSMAMSMFTITGVSLVPNSVQYLPHLDWNSFNSLIEAVALLRAASASEISLILNSVQDSLWDPLLRLLSRYSLLPVQKRQIIRHLLLRYLHADVIPFIHEYCAEITFTLTRHIGQLGDGDGQFLGTSRLCLCDSELFVVNSSLDRIQVFDKTTGRFLRKWTIEGKEGKEGQVGQEGPIVPGHGSHFLSVHKQRRELYVLSAGSRPGSKRVYVFSTVDCRLIRQFPVLDGFLINSICVLRSWILIGSDERIYVYNLEGRFEKVETLPTVNLKNPKANYGISNTMYDLNWNPIVRPKCKISEIYVSDPDDEKLNQFFADKQEYYDDGYNYYEPDHKNDIHLCNYYNHRHHYHYHCHQQIQSQSQSQSQSQHQHHHHQHQHHQQHNNACELFFALPEKSCVGALDFSDDSSSYIQTLFTHPLRYPVSVLNNGDQVIVSDFILKAVIVIDRRTSQGRQVYPTPPTPRSDDVHGSLHGPADADADATSAYASASASVRVSASSLAISTTQLDVELFLFDLESGCIKVLV